MIRHTYLLGHTRTSLPPWTVYTESHVLCKPSMHVDKYSMQILLSSCYYSIIIYLLLLACNIVAAT